jgi:hypothetical protein
MEDRYLWVDTYISPWTVTIVATAWAEAHDIDRSAWRWMDTSLYNMKTARARSESALEISFLLVRVDNTGLYGLVNPYGRIKDMPCVSDKQ